MKLTSLTLAFVLIASGATADLGQDVDRLARRLMTEVGGPPGMAIAVVQNGRIILQRGYGLADIESKTPVTPMSRFYIASSTKPFTAAAARLLAEQGKLDIDAPLSRTLPRLQLTPPLSTERVSLRDLLAHRAGITSGAANFHVSFTGGMTDEAIYQSFRQRTDSAPVGFRYSNVSYVLAGLALEEATGTSWQEVLRRLIFEPLEMKSTAATLAGLPIAASYTVDANEVVRMGMKPEESMHPAGGMVSTAPDLARFVIAQLGRGRINGRQILPERVIDELHAPQVGLKATWGPLQRYAYGLGWYLAEYEGELVVHHFGGFNGYYAHMSFMPEHDLGVVMLSNGGAQPAETLVWFVYDTLLKKQDVAARYDRMVGELRESLARPRTQRAEKREAMRAKLAASFSQAHPITAYLGTYRSARLGDVIVYQREGHLYASTGLIETVLVPEGGDAFSLDWAGDVDLEPVTFVFRDSSRATVFDWDGRQYERVEKTTGQ